MQSIDFIELWYAPTVIFVAFMYFFIKSFLLLGDIFTAAPLFDKKRVKNLNQFTSFTGGLTPVVVFYYSILIFKNAVLNTARLDEVQPVSIYLPLFYVILYVFMRICEKFFFKKVGRPIEHAQHLNSSGLFILAFIPVSTAMISAQSVLELILPLELLGLMFYFIFLEFNYTNVANTQSSAKHTNQTVVRGLLYYFWLSFVGSLMFVVSLLIYSANLPSASYNFLALIPTLSDQASKVCMLAASLVFAGLTLKMGGLFFFFFKADLYKYLPVYGVLLFSVYTAFFYIMLLYYLTGAVPFFGVSFKYMISCCLVGLTVHLLLAGNISQKNSLLLAAFSSVLTLCLCILVLVV